MNEAMKIEWNDVRQDIETIEDKLIEVGTCDAENITEAILMLAHQVAKLRGTILRAKITE